jgi:hypothetical protein
MSSDGGRTGRGHRTGENGVDRGGREGSAGCKNLEIVHARLGLAWDGAGRVGEAVELARAAEGSVRPIAAGSGSAGEGSVEVGEGVGKTGEAKGRGGCSLSRRLAEGRRWVEAKADGGTVGRGTVRGVGRRHIGRNGERRRGRRRKRRRGGVGERVVGHDRGLDAVEGRRGSRRRFPGRRSSRSRRRSIPSGGILETGPEVVASGERGRRWVWGENASGKERGLAEGRGRNAGIVVGIEVGGESRKLDLEVGHTIRRESSVACLVAPLVPSSSYARARRRPPPQLPQLRRLHLTLMLPLPELDLEVLPLVAVPHLPTFDVITDAEPKRLLLDPAHEVVELDEEREAVEGVALNRVEIGARDLGRRRPTVGRKADSDSLVEGDVSDVDDSLERAGVLGEGEGVEEDVGIERTLKGEVGKPV